MSTVLYADDGIVKVVYLWKELTTASRLSSHPRKAVASSG